MNWPQAKLESLAADVPYAFVGGPFGSNLTTRDYVEDGIPVIRGSNMNRGRYLDAKDLVFVSETKMRKDLSSNVARESDLVFTQRGTLGQVVMIPKSGSYPLYVISQSQMKLTVDEGKADRRFIYYYFSCPAVVGRITNLASSSGVPHINLKVLRNFELAVPPLETQRRIADILSAYDDLIENNLRRIALLAQAARELYREWFVRFRFPGHENTRIVDGLPEGWERRAAIDVVDVMSGGTPRTSVPAYWDGPIPFFTPKDATDNVYASETEKTLTEEGLNNCNSRLYPKDTIFITARGTVGKVNLAQEPMAMNQSCYALSGKSDLGQVFLYFALVEGVAQLRSHAVGAVFDAIIVDTFKRIPFVEPPKALIAAFNDFSAPSVDEMHKLGTRNRCLSRARDLLLPRLTSGQVAV